jgi:thioester reductase-like protein
MIVVTGATGKLGCLVVEGLLTKVPASEIVAAVRNPEKASDPLPRAERKCIKPSANNGNSLKGHSPCVLQCSTAQCQ